MANAKTPGIRITQAGINARYAADYQYVFNSDWPSLAIAFESLINVPYNNHLITIPHGLGFVPVFMGWVIQNGVSLGRMIAFSGANFGFGINILADATNVYISGPGGIDSTQIYQVSIKCYNLNITKSIDYTLPQTPTLPYKYDSTIGIKVSKYGKSVGSTDLRDYILHSRAQSPAVLSVVATGVILTNSNNFSETIYTYTNPVGYSPYAIGFYFTSNYTFRFPDGTFASVPPSYIQIAPGGQQALPFFLFNNIKKQYSLIVADSGLACIVVFRDPLIIPTTNSVIYNG